MAHTQELSSALSACWTLPRARTELLDVLQLPPNSTSDEVEWAIADRLTVGGGAEGDMARMVQRIYYNHAFPQPPPVKEEVDLASVIDPETQEQQAALARLAEEAAAAEGTVAAEEAVDEEAADEEAADEEGADGAAAEGTTNPKKRKHGSDISWTNKVNKWLREVKPELVSALRRCALKSSEKVLASVDPDKDFVYFESEDGEGTIAGLRALFNEQLEAGDTLHGMTKAVYASLTRAITSAPKKKTSLEKWNDPKEAKTRILLSALARMLLTIWFPSAEVPDVKKPAVTRKPAKNAEVNEYMAKKFTQEKANSLLTTCNRAMSLCPQDGSRPINHIFAALCRIAGVDKDISKQFVSDIVSTNHDPNAKPQGLPLTKKLRFEHGGVE